MGFLKQTTSTDDELGRRNLPRQVFHNFKSRGGSFHRINASGKEYDFIFLFKSHRLSKISLRDIIISIISTLKTIMDYGHAF